MPLATRPNETYDVVLCTDAHLPAGEQPVFVFRYLSVVQWKEAAKLNDQYDATKEAGELFDLAFQVIRKVLCNWRNMKEAGGKVIPYDPKKLDTLLSLQETTELMMRAVDQGPTVEDKKKLDLPLDSSTAKSAKTAKARQSAKTDPQK